jgi:hypothetical protein
LNPPPNKGGYEKEEDTFEATFQQAKGNTEPTQIT